jgi:hypothetical protein
MSPSGGFFGGRGNRPGARSAAQSAAPADKASPLFWRGLKTGDFIGISDSEAFEESLAAGADGGASGAIDCRVGDVRRFALRGKGLERGRSARRNLDESHGTYTFAELEREGSGLLYLVLVDPEPGSGPELFELRLYFAPPELEPGTRDEWIDRGDSWLFLPPPDPEDFLSSELEYAPYPDVPPVDGRKLVFSRSGPGPLYAEALDTGSPSIIAEYECEGADPDGRAGEGSPANPLLLVVEEGWMRSDGTEPEEGGCLTALIGKRLRPGELEHWPS